LSFHVWKCDFLVNIDAVYGLEDRGFLIDVTRVIVEFESVVVVNIARDVPECPIVIDGYLIDLVSITPFLASAIRGIFTPIARLSV
jgi:hypothetical protein